MQSASNVAIDLESIIQAVGPPRSTERGVAAEHARPQFVTADLQGKFIVVEGLDRSGKSTQCERLAKALQEDGLTVTHLRFPGKCCKTLNQGIRANILRAIVFAHLSPDRSTPIGKLIDDYLKKKADIEDHAIHLLFSANRWELA
jgi:dTMP kinase